MKPGRALAWAAVGAAGFLVLVEALLRVLPVSTATMTGYHVDPLILSYPAGHAWTASTGWDLRNAQRLRSNNAGFLAHRDFAPNAEAVGLIGDSFVEASMLRAQDRPDVQLELAVGRPVFAFGGPGSSLLDYAERIRFASERYGVRDFVVLVEQGDALQAVCGSGNVHAVCIEVGSTEPVVRKRPPPGTVKRVLRHVALAQYFSGQLNLSAGGLWRQAVTQALPPTVGPMDAQAATAAPAPIDVSVEPTVAAVTRLFFERVKPYVRGGLVVVVDSDRSAAGGASGTLAVARARFLTLAVEARAQVVDTAPLYEAHRRASTLRLDVGPYDAHLNALGVRIVMQAAAQALRGPDGTSSRTHR